MTGQQKLIIISLPMHVIYNLLHMHTLPEELEPSSPAQQACRSTNLATDPLHHCFVPQLRAQLFTYHHLQPSLPSFPLSQEAPGKSAASLRISYGIVPVLPTGTRGNLSSMEDTGITYKTCADLRRSYTMVDWHASNQAAQQSNKIITRICSICRIYRICKI